MNLNLNYKKPLFVGKEYLMIAEFEKQINRKIFLKAKILNENQEIIVEGNLLFLTVDWKSAYLKNILKIIN